MKSDRDFVPPVWKVVYLMSFTTFLGLFSSILTYIAVMALSLSEGPLKWRTILLIWGMILIPIAVIMGRSFAGAFVDCILPAFHRPIGWFIGGKVPNIDFRSGKSDILTILFASNTPTTTSDSSV